MSMVMINESPETITAFYDKNVRKFYGKMADKNKIPQYKKKKVDNKLMISFDHDDQPFESTFYFDNNKCYFQEINIYCSRCTRDIVDQILLDPRYVFKAESDSRYISEKDPTMIMQLKETSSNSESCDNVRVFKLGKKTP